MKALKPLAGGSSSARAVNADGTVIVGSSKSVGAFTHACRWVNGQPEDLSSAAIQQNGLAYAVSDDGTVIGGQIGFNFPGSAFVWTKGLGMLEATDYLALHGVTVPSGYKLENVYAISGDGLTFGGVARDLTTTKREGWVARVTSTPLCAADCNANGLLDIDDFICFQTLFVLNEPQADCDGNVAINIDDFECFQTLFALGC
jgi:probable HAF family extracellular repeat protein